MDYYKKYLKYKNKYNLAKNSLNMSGGAALAKLDTEFKENKLNILFNINNARDNFNAKLQAVAEEALKEAKKAEEALKEAKKAEDEAENKIKNLENKIKKLENEIEELQNKIKKKRKNSNKLNPELSSKMNEALAEKKALEKALEEAKKAADEAKKAADEAKKVTDEAPEVKGVKGVNETKNKFNKWTTDENKRKIIGLLKATINKMKQKATITMSIFPFTSIIGGSVALDADGAKLVEGIKKLALKLKKQGDMFPFLSLFDKMLD